VAPDAVILIVTDPPEPLIDVTRHLVGHERVIGTSTYLDSLRFRVHLAERFAVSPACVEANVVGEHGTSSVFLWSSARIGGMGVADALAKRGSGFDAFRREGGTGRALCQYHDHRRPRREPIRRRHGRRVSPRLSAEPKSREGL
jgi:hypothetical protein